MPIAASPDLEHAVDAARDQLARLEQEHADLVLELRDFETRYQARVGPLHARLEAAQLHLAEYKLRIELLQWRGSTLAPSQLEAEVEYRLRDQRQQAEFAYEQAASATRSAAAATPVDPQAELDLKPLYRELAKRTHPDLARDEADRAARSERMQIINALYAQHDVPALREWLRRLAADGAVRPESPDERHARLLTERDQLTAAIRRIKGDIAELNHSPLMALKLDEALGRARGRDVLGEVAGTVQAQLADAERELDALIARFMQLVNV